MRTTRGSDPFGPSMRGAVALLTGASRGIGPHIARALARQGVDLALVARSRPDLERVATEVRALGVRAAVVPADVGNPGACEGIVASVEEALGPVDLLVNDAGLETVGAFVSPRLGAWLPKALGVTAFQRRKVGA